tara:strand:+ start:743 stop:1123 length:381 start_codon:yes stop_codon:yes gene_type:complete
MVSRKKDTYWHTLAKGLLSMGLKPASVAKCIKDVFPLSEVTGRHVGAYNRRLKTEDKFSDLPAKPTINMNEALSISHGLVNDEDRFIYDCSIGAMKRTLKCFEMKLMIEEQDSEDDIDTWIGTLTQ